MKDLNEKQDMQRCIDDLACNFLVDLFKEKNNEEFKPIPLMIMVLEQIKAASTSLSADETEEHILDNTQKYLKLRIDILKYLKTDSIKGNTFNDCIQYLEKIAQDALNMQDNELGQQINNRLFFFIKKLKDGYNETE